jgi:MoaA/NifB/PqqE/SkfB family radical SAM enzyme
MTRQKGVIDPESIENLLTQAYDLGAREVGMYSGAEPLTCKDLDKHIAVASKIGYTYIYITTNGTLADQDRLKKLIDAGLDSIKFSINGGDRETYNKIHGKDDFDKVCANVEFVSKYRESLDRQLYLYVSFIEVEENAASFEAYRKLFEPIVDEIYHAIAINQSGQMPDQKTEKQEGICPIPFNQVNFSREGYLRVCCNDYQNYLAVEDLNKMSLKDAWFGDIYKEIRRKHLNGTLEGTLCDNCWNNNDEKVEQLNKKLSDLEMI